MDLLQNPFYVLHATLRDNRQKIMELSEECSLHIDPNVCVRARADLTNPRKRLSAEIAWLPGLGPKRINELLGNLERSVTENDGVKLIPIARANLLAAGLLRLSTNASDDVIEQILQLARVFECIDPENLRMILNEERIVSGFSEVTDLSVIEEEIQERRRYYRQVIKTALNNFAAGELVDIVTTIVKSATDNGEEQGPILVDDLVDSYEVEVQPFIEKETGNIEILIEKVMLAADANKSDQALVSMIKQLTDVVRNWDTVAQPIHISTKSRGLEHAASRQVAGLVRELSVHLYNEHEKLDFSRQLTDVLQEVFAEVVGVAERVAEDAKALGDIIEQRTKFMEDAKKRADDWRREITYEASIGTVFKGNFRISPDGVEWKGYRWDLDSITRIRWGGTRNSINGIPTGTTYKIFFANNTNVALIELRKTDIYSNVVDRLWKVVGIRLITEYLEGLRSGKVYRFRSAFVRDQGIEFEQRKLFSQRHIFCLWNELAIWESSGFFCIGKQSDRRISVSLSYQDDDNVHVLAAVIRTFWERGGDRLSDLLEKE